MSLQGVPLDKFTPPTEEVAWLQKLAAELEAHHHEVGWDEVPPMLYRVHQIDVLADAPEMLEAVKLAEIVQGGKALVVNPLPLSDPGPELSGMAFGFNMILEVELDSEEEDNEWGSLVKETFDKPLMALMLITEAWLRTSEMDLPEEFEGKPFADIPGSVEVRQAMVVNSEHLLLLTRERGEEPTVSYWSRAENGEGSVRMTGVVTEALTSLYDVGKKLEQKATLL